MRVNVRIDNHTDVPLESWQDQLKRRRRKIGPLPEQSETPTPADRSPPDALIDEYAAPFPW
jgi:hypothetical protein